MLMSDNSKNLVNRSVEECKRNVKLSPDNQSTKESGHSSAPYGSGPSASAAVPGGKPGTGSY